MGEHEADGHALEAVDGRRPWVRRLLRNVDAWERRGWAEGIKQLVDVLPDPDDDGDVP